eukprot:4349478-Pyramimonas_sp.AAC.1
MPHSCSAMPNCTIYCTTAPQLLRYAELYYILYYCPTAAPLCRAVLYTVLYHRERAQQCVAACVDVAAWRTVVGVDFRAKRWVHPQMW